MILEEEEPHLEILPFAASKAKEPALQEFCATDSGSGK